MLGRTVFQSIVVTSGALLAVLGALWYFRRVRVERPAIGVFNSRDLVVLGSFVVLVPFLYLALPGPVLTATMLLAFGSAIATALRPLLPARPCRVVTLGLLGAQLMVTSLLADRAGGPQAAWLLNTAMVLMAAIGVSNLYVQGGLDLRQITFFALFMGVYDSVFAWVFPITPRLLGVLADEPITAFLSFGVGRLRAGIGLGDLLIYSLFVTAAYKGFGRRGAVVSIGTVVLFGAVAPSLVAGIWVLLGKPAPNIIPAQVIFAPAAFAVAMLLRRSTRERTTSEWAQATRPARPTDALVPAAAAA